MGSMGVLVDGQGLVLAAMLVERVFDALHDGDHFFFLEALADDLDADWEAVHLVRVVVLVCSFRNAVQVLKAECEGELVLNAVDMGNGDDATGVVELGWLVIGLEIWVSRRLTRLKRNVYPQLLTASFIPPCGTAGVAFGGVNITSILASCSHHSCHFALYASLFATHFHCS